MMQYDSVRAKKSFGQHFLNDDTIAEAIVEALPKSDAKMDALEIGPGMGVLTKFLLNRSDLNLSAVELDKDSVAYLLPLMVPGGIIWFDDVVDWIPGTMMAIKEMFGDDYIVSRTKKVYVKIGGERS